MLSRDKKERKVETVKAVADPKWLLDICPLVYLCNSQQQWQQNFLCVNLSWAMCDALHAMTCLNQCDVMSLLEGFFFWWEWLLYCVLWLFGAFRQILTASWTRPSEVLWSIKPCTEHTFVFIEPWTVQDSGKGICKDLWWFFKPSIPWLFQPFWRTTQVHYPTITLGGSIPVYWIAHLSHTCARWVENGHMHRNIKIPGIQD